MYQHPGVYIEEIASGSRPIEAAGTSTALIVGFALKGPINEAVFITSYDQYVQEFGGINDLHGSSLGITVDEMGHSVKAFFQNGGSKAYIVRLAGPTPAKSETKLVVPVNGAAVLADIDNFLQFEATSEGTWADKLVLEVNETNDAPFRYTLNIGRIDSQNKFQAIESFIDVSLDPVDAEDFAGSIVNSSSDLVRIEPATFGDLSDSDKVPHMRGSLTGGDISGLLNSEISALDGQGFDVELNPGPHSVAVVLVTPSSLVDIASQIQTQVIGTTFAPENPRSGFTCTVQHGRLVLRGGETNHSAADAATAEISAITATAPTTDCRAVLKLRTGAPLVNDRATTVTGEQAFLATFSLSSKAELSGGLDGSLPGTAEYSNSTLHKELLKIRDISIVLLPGQSWRDSAVAAKSNIQAFLSHATRMKNRMLIIDPDPSLEFTSSKSFLDEGFPTSTYSATYYPWVEVANPHYHPELRADRQQKVKVPPSAFAAGVWARTDGRRGVWKAPAGLQASVAGISNTVIRIGDDEQDSLNPVGVNCIRRIISDAVIWGTRTLGTKSDPEWRYLPVRRTAMMIEESIYQSIQWAVFEPNNHLLWSSLRLNIGNFMNGLFRAGAFQGEKASDAYFVRCGLGDTMTQGDIDAGRVVVLVGFAPVKPAEFVIVRLQQIVGQQ